MNYNCLGRGFVYNMSSETNIHLVFSSPYTFRTWKQLKFLVGRRNICSRSGMCRYFIWLILFSPKYCKTPSCKLPSKKLLDLTIEPVIKINPNYANSVELRNLYGKVIISIPLMLYRWPPLHWTYLDYTSVIMTFPQFNLSQLYFSHLVLLYYGNVTICEHTLMVIPIFLLITVGFCFNFPTNRVEEVYFCMIYVGLASTLVFGFKLAGI